jgi:hypothetical protein
VWPTILVYTWQFKWNSSCQQSGTLPAAAWPSGCLCYRPAVSFRHLLLIVFIPSRRKFGACFKNINISCLTVLNNCVRVKLRKFRLRKSGKGLCHRLFECGRYSSVVCFSLAVCFKRQAFECNCRQTVLCQRLVLLPCFAPSVMRSSVNEFAVCNTR